MIDSQTIFEIHQLKRQGLSERNIAKTLNVTRKTVHKYLKDPMPKRPVIRRKSKLDPFKPQIKHLLEQDNRVSSEVIKQRIEKMGYQGGITIIRDYLQQIRPKKKQAFIRFESEPGKQMQIDWGHFGSLSYGDAKRKLYALAVIEGYSRMLYVEFTHSQNQSALHQCLLNAFTFFGGTPQEIVVDNMLTAVIERQGSLIRFNDAFLRLLMPFKLVPIACNPAAPHEKGKVERAIGYVRKNFWPLRTFKDLYDINAQVIQWLNLIANTRIHQGTGKVPDQRFKSIQLNPLPDLLPDCRQTHNLLVHKDFAIRFDSNAYTAPPWTVGKHLTVKADQYHVSLYLNQKRLAVHHRCWAKKKRVELPVHRLEAKKLNKKLWYDKKVAAFASIAPETVDYLTSLTQHRLPVKRNVEKMIALKNQYGVVALIWAIRKATTYNAYGADYVENILRQNMLPKNEHPPVKLKEDALNNIQLDQPSLAQYDALIIRRKNHE